MMPREHRRATASSISLTTIAMTLLISPALALNPTVSQGCFSSSNGLTFQGHNIYQSQGSCQQACVGLNQPVMGLTNGGDCWCGNLTPASGTKVSDSQCSVKCLGWPDQTCGGNGAFGVFLTGTQASVGSAQEDSGNKGDNPPPQSSGPAPIPSTDVATAPPVVSTIVSQGPPVTKTLDPETVTASGQSTTIPPSVVTVGGPTTQLVTIQPTTAVVPAAQANGANNDNNGPSPTPTSGTSTGAKAGIAVGAVVAVLALGSAVGFGVFYFMKKKRNQYAGSTAGGAGRIGRNDTISSYSTSGGFAGSGTHPGIYGRNGSLNDSRLDPGMVETRRGSVGSVFDDSEDYSRRVLKVTN